MTRAMTVSDVVERILCVVGIDSLTESEAKELAASLVGVTIVHDPDPRPDFASMTTVELAEWLASNDPNDWAGLKRRMVLRAHAIADAKGMGR